MSKEPEQEQHQLLPNESSTPPDTAAIRSSPGQTVLSGLVQSSGSRHRPGYARVPSVSLPNEAIVNSRGNASIDATDRDEITNVPSSAPPSHGLGIAMGTASRAPVTKAHRVNISAGSKSPLGMEEPAGPYGTPDSSAPLMSPPSTGGFSGNTMFSNGVDTSYSPSKHMAKHSTSSIQSTLPPSLYAKSDAGLLSVRSRYDEFEPHEQCRSHRRVKQKLGSWVSATIIGLAVFSTVLSSLFLIVALRGPRYGRLIHTKGTFTASSAAFLTSFFAKLIELSFVTVFVAFLGQVLARRAYKERATKGITLAELSMRTWIMQPGTILTHWESVRYAGITVLGLVSLLAALVALLYGTAATALVQPQLKYPHWNNVVMHGLVKTEFANPDYIQSNCKTPITKVYDSEYYTASCIALEHVAMAYHNYFGYISEWTDVVQNGTGKPIVTASRSLPCTEDPADHGSGSPDLAERPKGHALVNDNTTVIAPWIEKYDVRYVDGVIVNNVSMAMPHSGLLQAAVDPMNDIMQPNDLDGLGVYSIRASVPSPVVHVLCATLNTVQLTPFVFQLWNNGTSSSFVNTTTWLSELGPTDRYLNGTALDDVFGWGEKYGSGKWPPIFPKLPINYNTITNDTSPPAAYGRQTIYILGKGGPTDYTDSPTDDANPNYALCQLQVSQTPFCMSQYNASASGGTLEAVCEDDDPLQYNNSLPTASSGNYSLNKDWPNIASIWADSLSLNAGISDGNASNARLLTQFILTNASLNPALPSMAEALAVMAGCTLIQSAQDAPFTEFWNYTLPTMVEGQHQAFNASTRAQQYASGGTQDYQNAFYLVLFTVTVLNVAVLVYFLTHRDWYTDFSEPAHLFTLAVNSPPSKELAGSCGGGPHGDQFRVNWKLNNDGDHVYVESQERSETEDSPGLRRRRLSQGFDIMMSPVRKATEKFEKRRSR